MINTWREDASERRDRMTCRTLADPRPSGISLLVKLARNGDVSNRWQLFATAGYLLVHRPTDDVATVVGIIEARGVENNRRQWLAGVAHARAELGDEAFEGLVGVGAGLDDEEAIAFRRDPA
jgi:hypothetical protein